MSVWKNLALGFLSFLLFLSLSIFGLAFLINSTFLNPRFIDSELDRLDVPLLVEEVLSEEITEPEMSAELKAAIVDNADRIEPLVKEQMSTFIYSMYDYLLGKRQSPDLILTLRNTILNTEFINALIDEMDISPLASALIDEQLSEEVPVGMEYLVEYSDEYLDDAIAENEPWLKDQISTTADWVFDYLLGESQSLDAEISLEPVIDSLEDIMREPFLESPPAELAHRSRSQLATYYDDFFDDLSDEGSTFELDETVFDSELPAEITEALAEAEETLELSRQYISSFRLGYILLIVFMLLLIAGIILISRDVRYITRDLGISFLVYGVIELVIVLVGKHLAKNFLPLSDIPTYLETWTMQFLSNFLAPLLWFSVGLIIVGIALIVVSFIYKRRQTSSPVLATEPLPDHQ